MSDRLQLLVRGVLGIAIGAAVLAWLWSSARHRVQRLAGALPADLMALAGMTWVTTILIATAMALGAFGVLHPVSWCVLAVLAGFALRAGGGSAAGTPAPTDAAPWVLPSWPFLGALGGLVIGRTVYGLRNPPSDVDSFHYHLPMIAHWIATGGLGVPLQEPRQLANYYPGNVELLALGAAWMTGRETLATIPGVLSLGLLGLALRGLALELGARRAIAEALTIVFVASHGVVQLTLGLRVENMMAAWLAVALLFALRWHRTGSPGDIEVALCSSGLLAGAKVTGPPLAALVLAIAIAGRGFGAGLKSLTHRPIALAVSALTGGFWMARNLIAAGNPLFPATIVIGPWTLPGIEDTHWLGRTSQLSLWLAGHAGLLTPLNVWLYYGPGALVIAIGAVAWAVRRRRAGEDDRRWTEWLLLVFAMLALGMYLLQPFSGSNAPPEPGRAPVLVSENVRFLMPMFVALLPLAALGLSGLPPAVVVSLATAVVLVGLQRQLGHVLPGTIAAAALIAAWILRPRDLANRGAFRVALGLLACLALAVAVVVIEPDRERLMSQAWNRFIARFDNLPAAVIDRVRAEAAGRPIAVVGVSTHWPFYGRDFSGRPAYVPVGRPLEEVAGAFRFSGDHRERADRELWLRNLSRARAAFVVVGRAGRPIEDRPEHPWCGGDSSRFEPMEPIGEGEVYRVRGS